MKTTYTMVMTLFALGLLGCAPSPPSRNQQQPAVSPSGKYVLTVPIEKQTTNPQYQGTPVWKVTITDSSGTVLYQDIESTMVGTLNVYWGWDSHDNVWLYNSDDGAIWKWEETSEGWSKIRSQTGDGIPDWVLPDYAKKK